MNARSKGRAEGKHKMKCTQCDCVTGRIIETVQGYQHPTYRECSHELKAEIARLRAELDKNELVQTQLSAMASDREEARLELAPLYSGETKLPDALFLAKLAREKIRQLESERQWIPVSERLPEEHKVVLVYEGGHIIRSLVEDGKFVEIENPEYIYEHLFPTHWMPLPQPPEVE